ncbi:MAG: hypothetical protein QOJ12_3530, partial [Thermoleophilales bacterium]|nr:hypothetical protein [Thermoleophilales bacterium]
MRDTGNRALAVLLGTLVATAVGVSPAAATTGAVANSATARVASAGTPRRSTPKLLKRPVQLSAAAIRRFQRLEARAGHVAPKTPI